MAGQLNRTATTSPGSMTFRRRLPLSTVAALTLCVLHAWMAASVSRIFSTTADEIVHLTAGYSYWKTSDFHLQPENGILPQRWAALPLLFQNVKFPPPDSAAAKNANAWQLGDKFFHESGNDLPAMLAAARAMIAVWSALLCWFTYCFARQLFGVRAGFVALMLAVFSPTLLAHGGLATSDTAAALGFIGALFTWWRLLHRVTVGRILAAVLGVSFLALSKFSVVLFAPTALLLAVVRLLRPSPLVLVFGQRRSKATGAKRIAGVAALLVITAGLCVTLIWSAYGFRYSAAAPGAMAAMEFVQPWERVLLAEPAKAQMTMADGRIEEPSDAQPHLAQHVIRWARDHHLLPEAYLYGAAFVVKNARGRLAYFDGDYRVTGWRMFFPAAFALKTTLPALLLIVAGVVGSFRIPRPRRRVWIYRLSPLVVLLAVYWAAAIFSHLNIGHRHLLPTYPLCFILAASCVPRTFGLNFKTCLLSVLLAWHVAASLWIRPDYLAYFNPLSGGPRQGHRWFVDSSLDWGQDLPRLKSWCDTHAPHEKIFLSYFGSGSPVHEGITAIRFGDGYFDSAPRKTPARLSGGIYCISATMFRRVYTHVRGPWTLEYEAAYQKLNAWLRHMRSQGAGQPATDVDGSPVAPGVAADRLFNYEQLQFGRLCHALQFREPADRAGYSILIYRLSDEEVAFALGAPLAAVNERLIREAASIVSPHSQ